PPPTVQPAPPPTTPSPTSAAMNPPSKELPPEGHPLSATVPINIYGSLRFKSAVDSDKTSEIQDNASRIGLKAEMPIGNTSASAYARAEVGMRLIRNDTSVVLYPDPGAPTATANNVFNARLGYVGFKTPLGTMTWGKQWSVYYDIGGWTDQFSAWGGEALGTFNAGTDGSPSGTGRVDQALIYRTPDAPLKLALQAQNRSLTDSQLRWGDTLAASLQWGEATGLSLGAAYVKVRDGVQQPGIGQPKAGDRSFIAGAKFYQEPIYLALSFADFTNHEQDDAGNWFSGRGYEFFAQYSVSPQWSIYGGFNDQKPDDSYLGLFRRRYVDVGAKYVFHGTSFLFLEIKPEDSRNADGTKGRKSAVAVGAFFDF
ncbi:MAG: porin, partial [Thermoanaerobaculales bacterium]